MSTIVDEVTDLLQHLIRNACVNDGSRDSGHEARNVDVLRGFLDGPGLDLDTYEPVPGRPSLVARIAGSDPTAPSLMLMGHTDVVPANPDRWRHDPFGGELVDGFVWGRGAVDMFNLTATMAVTVKELARTGFRPRGDLIYLAVADEEAGGTHGAEWLVDHEPDAVRTDYVVTEFGGQRFPLGDGPPTLPITVAEKGPHWTEIHVTGTPGHGSMPLRTDNAAVTAAEVVARIATYRPPAVLTEVWQGFVSGLALPEELRQLLLDPVQLDEVLEQLPDIGLARFAHACTHTTFSPNVVVSGTKVNVIPDRATVQVDIRALPGHDSNDIRAMLEEALGHLADRCEIVFAFDQVASASPTDTPLWDVLSQRAAELVPGANVVPFLLPGATDSRYLRRLGAVCYGFGLYTERIPFDEFAAMFHGDDERIDVGSLELTTQLWLRTVRDMLE